MNTCDNIIYQNKNPIEYLVTPISPYFICNHYISTELEETNWKYIGINLELNANNLLKNKEISFYIHWPFCDMKCPYCDFNSYFVKIIELSLVQLNFF
jgi:coproporphyrinogen III oxidase-like Fe-S oxidoreductase